MIRHPSEISTALLGLAPYNGILDIEAVPRLFSRSTDQDVVDTLARLIINWKLEDYLGVALLHTHFAIREDEILVERIEDPYLVIRPERIPEIQDELVPMLWRLDTEAGLVPLQWRVGSAPEAAAQIAAFFKSEAFQDLCSSQPDRNRIGLVLMSSREREIGRPMLERTYKDERTLALEVMQESPQVPPVRTTIYFRRLSAAERYCDKYSRTYCDRESDRYCREESSEWHSAHVEVDRGYKHVRSSQTFHERVSK